MSGGDCNFGLALVSNSAPLMVTARLFTRFVLYGVRSTTLASI